MDNCCGLDDGEVYEIELMSEIDDGTEVYDCSRVVVQKAAEVGDTLRVEILSQRYVEQRDCSEVRTIRILSASSVHFQDLIGPEMSGGAGIQGHWSSILGGGAGPRADHPAWQFGVSANGCKGVNKAFDPESPDLAFVVAYSRPQGSCVDAWEAKLTRVKEDE